MDVDQVWQAVLEVNRFLGPCSVGRSEQTGRPAISVAGRETVRWVSPGVVGLRVTPSGQELLADRFASDPAIAGGADAGWVRLRLSADDVPRLRPLFVAAAAGD
jgi:hypothetical protein